MTNAADRQKKYFSKQYSFTILTLGGVPWSRGGVPVMVVDMTMAGEDDVVTIVGDTVVP